MGQSSVTGRGSRHFFSTYTDSKDHEPNTNLKLQYSTQNQHTKQTRQVTKQVSYLYSACRKVARMPISNRIILLFCLVSMTSLEVTSSLIPPSRSNRIKKISPQNTKRCGNFAQNERSPLHSLGVGSDGQKGKVDLPFLRSGGSIGGGGRLFRRLIHSATPVDRQNIVMTVALFSTYFAVMGAKCSLPSTFNLITSTNSGLNFHDQDPNQLISKVLTISTGAISFGKLILGPVIDKFGGVSCLKVSLLMLMGCLGMIASTNSFRVFALCWITVDFIFSSCWAACLNAIHHTFPEDEWASNIGA